MLKLQQLEHMQVDKTRKETEKAIGNTVKNLCTNALNDFKTITVNKALIDEDNLTRNEGKP